MSGIGGGPQDELGNGRVGDSRRLGDECALKDPVLDRTCDPDAMATPTSKPRSTSQLVATKPACAPLLAMYRRAEAIRPQTWTQVEDAFVRAMEGFDANVAAGVADIGELQNGKGDFLNDLLALLLEGCGGVQLYSRGGVPGLVFANHNLDVTYPNTGVVKFTLKVKAVGTPRHPLSPKQKAIGRPGSADLAKRVKEVAFKTIDLKAEYGRIMASHGQPASAPGGNLTTWLHTVPPRAYLFIAARVVNKTDLDATIAFARIASQVVDGVGLFCFGPTSETSPTTYRRFGVPPEVSMDRVLYRACQDLLELQREGVHEVPAGVVGPAATAEEVLRRVDHDPMG